MSTKILFLTAFIIFLDLFESILCHKQEFDFDFKSKEIDYVRETLQGSRLKIHSMNVGQILLNIYIFLRITFYTVRVK